jgi:uncharacterized membrane protein YsdA (DUF1294 family)/cold shock CspA family protein
MEGIVVKFDEKRGFGFIRSKALSEDVFVHIRELPDRQPLSVGQQVQFETQKTDKGFSAVEVIPGNKRISPFWLYGIAAIVVTIASMTLLYSSGLHIVVCYIVSINLSTFLFYGYDKTIAGSSLLRVPEWVLHGLSMGGGSPAGLIAQKAFRHKTIKGSFQFVYWAIVVIQAIILVLLLIEF